MGVGHVNASQMHHPNPFPIDWDSVREVLDHTVWRVWANGHECRMVRLWNKANIDTVLKTMGKDGPLYIREIVVTTYADAKTQGLHLVRECFTDSDGVWAIEIRKP